MHGHIYADAAKLGFQLVHTTRTVLCACRRQVCAVVRFKLECEELSVKNKWAELHENCRLSGVRRCCLWITEGVCVHDRALAQHYDTLHLSRTETQRLSQQFSVS